MIEANIVVISIHVFILAIPQSTSIFGIFWFWGLRKEFLGLGSNAIKMYEISLGGTIF